MKRKKAAAIGRTVYWAVARLQIGWCSLFPWGLFYRWLLSLPVLLFYHFGCLICHEKLSFERKLNVNKETNETKNLHLSNKDPAVRKCFFSLSLSRFYVARFRMSVTFLMELFEISLKFEFKMFVEAEWVYVPKCWMYWSGSLKHLFEQQQPQQQHKCWHANQREKNHTL